MVSRRWYTAADVNILTFYTYASLLMIQKCVAPILRWETAANMLYQRLVLVTVLIVPQEFHPWSLIWRHS